jgi:nucleotide-binding universal stress UspA family protein
VELDTHKMVAEAEKRVGEIVREQLPAGMKVHTIARHGTVYNEILDVADELGIDQIVMTAHRAAVSEYLLGTNAARVVRHAKCSVNIVRRN